MIVNWNRKVYPEYVLPHFMGWPPSCTTEKPDEQKQ